jgi:tetratricopeptide (TPR) repeat protein
MLPQCAYARGDLKGAISLTEQYLARDELPISARIWRMIQQTQGFGLSALYREAGRYQESIEVMEEAKRYSGRDDSRAAWAVGNALLCAGRAKEALDVAHFITSNFEDPRAAFYALRIRAGATVALGNLGTARVAVTQLQVAQDRWGGIARALALATEAEIALAENKPREALDALDNIELQGVGTGGVLQDNGGGGLPDVTYRELRARAHRMAGRLGKAAEVHQKLLSFYGGHALSHYSLGQIYEEMDRPDDAEREYGVFLEMWSGADEGLPQLVDARERLEALAIAR